MISALNHVAPVLLKSQFQGRHTLLQGIPLRLQRFDCGIESIEFLQILLIKLSGPGGLLGGNRFVFGFFHTDGQDSASALSAALSRRAFRRELSRFLFSSWERLYAASVMIARILSSMNRWMRLRGFPNSARIFSPSS